jgi:hypothetical protein
MAQVVKRTLVLLSIVLLTPAIFAADPKIIGKGLKVGINVSGIFGNDSILLSYSFN